MSEFETTVRILEERIVQLEEQLEDTEVSLREAKEIIAGSESGWRSPVDVKDDGLLPIPRLEIVFEPSEESGWRQHTASYRLVIRHLVGNLLAIPLGLTTTRGGDGSPPTEKDLPYRDGAHIHHDMEHLRLPAFFMIPGMLPRALVGGGYEYQLKLGREHRRD